MDRCRASRWRGGMRGKGLHGGDAAEARDDGPIDAATGADMSTGAADASSGTCSNQDCPASQVCGYEADLTCSIQAHCILREFCNNVTVGCGCDGGIVLVGCGVASRPFTGISPCSSGTGGTPNAATPVSVTQLMGKEVLPCTDGYAHPNICCQGAPYQATTCAADLAHPFDDCGPGSSPIPIPTPAVRSTTRQAAYSLRVLI